MPDTLDLARLADTLDGYAEKWAVLHRDIADDFSNAATIVRRSAAQASRISELESALRPFSEASAKFTSNVHYGGIEEVRAAPHPEDFRQARNVLGEKA